MHITFFRGAKGDQSRFCDVIRICLLYTSDAADE